MQNKMGHVLLGMYAHRNMHEICERMIPEISDMTWLSRGDSVFVKVVCNSPQCHPAVTDPDTVEAVVRFLHDRGAGIIYVGDQAGVEYVRLRREGRKSSTRELMSKNGLLSAVETSGATLHCFDDRGWDGYFQPELDFNNNWNRHMWLPKIIRNVDHIVYLPRLGAHAIAGYTCAIKTAVGWLRDDSRMYLHQRGATFFEKIAEINHAKEIRDKLRFCLTLGSAAMTNYGPDFGEKYHFDKVLAIASVSLVDHDAMAATLLPWLNKRTKSAFDLFGAHRFANLWSQIVVLTCWGWKAMADYKTIIPYAFGERIENDPCISRLSMLQSYRPEKIDVHKQGNRFPDGLIPHLSQAGGGMFLI